MDQCTCHLHPPCSYYTDLLECGCGDLWPPEDMEQGMCPNCWFIENEAVLLPTKD